MGQSTASGSSSHSGHGHDHEHGHRHDHGQPEHVHDWRSAGYVDDWVATDLERAGERRPHLARMLAAAPFEKTWPLRVLDVGGGYGAVTEETLRVFPNARVVLQDYSEIMLDRAKHHLSSHAASVAYALCDLLDPSWKNQVHGPFDLAVSAIALHNLRDVDKIFTSYRDIGSLLTPGGWFLNCDLLDRVGGVDAHIDALCAAGFHTADKLWANEKLAIVRAQK